MRYDYGNYQQPRIECKACGLGMLGISENEDPLGSGVNPRFCNCPGDSTQFEVGHTYSKCFGCGVENKPCKCPPIGAATVTGIDKENGIIMFGTHAEQATPLENK